MPPAHGARSPRSTSSSRRTAGTCQALAHAGRLCAVDDLVGADGYREPVSESPNPGRGGNTERRDAGAQVAGKTEIEGDQGRASGRGGHLTGTRLCSATCSRYFSMVRI